MGRRNASIGMVQMSVSTDHSGGAGGSKMMIIAKGNDPGGARHGSSFGTKMIGYNARGADGIGTSSPA